LFLQAATRIPAVRRRIGDRAPATWKPVAYAAAAPECGVTLDGGPLRDAYSVAADGVYVNLFAPSTITWQVQGETFTCFPTLRSR
jgi:hypothetical protein